MKRLTYCVFLAVIIPIASCQREQAHVSPDLTSTIEKIETTYKDGDVKIETIWNGVDKIVPTQASKELQDEINRKITAELKNFNNRQRSARILFDNYDIGVIPASASCPFWSERIMFHLDNQDSQNISYANGWTGSWNHDHNGNSNIYFCRVDGRLFSNAGEGDYSVLQLGTNMPSMASQYYRVDSDDEDNSNANFYQIDSKPINTSSGDMWPNISNTNTTFFLFSFLGTTSGINIPFPDLGFNYGVLSRNFTQYGYNYKVVRGNLGTGEFYTDNENSNTASHISRLSPTPSPGLVIVAPGAAIYAPPYSPGSQNFNLGYHLAQVK